MTVARTAAAYTLLVVLFAAGVAVLFCCRGWEWGAAGLFGGAMIGFALLA